MSELIEKITVEDGVLVMSVGTDIYHKTGKITDIELPEEGSEIEQGEEFITVIGMEDDLHLRAPLSGIVLEVNELFTEELLKNKNNARHLEWIVRIEPSDADDLLAFEE